MIIQVQMCRNPEGQNDLFLAVSSCGFFLDLGITDESVQWLKDNVDILMSNQSL